MGTEANRYLTFRICRKDFATDASRVRAILPLHELLRVPAPCGDVLGIATLNGRTVTVVDLRTKLMLPHASAGKRRQIVVVEIRGAALAGFIADRVADVVEYRKRDLRRGVLKGIGRPRRLLDFDEFLSESELAAGQLWPAGALP